jgi:hypothetical protein
MTALKQQSLSETSPKAKGLEAACVAKAAVDLGLNEIIDKALICLPERDKELSEAAEVIVYKALGTLQQVLLQLCE